MSKDERLVDYFWNAHNEEYFKRDTLEALFKRAVNCFEKDAIEGKGIPFIRLFGNALYKKKDILKFIEQRSTTT